jgi:glycosyltransferase involved in cell wall biosynthesis
MKILFIDQSGELGGAQLCLLDIAKDYRDQSVVCLFADGPFRNQLEQHQIPVQMLLANLPVRKESSFLQGIRSLLTLIPLIIQVAVLSFQYDVIYANTQKALVVGAVASLFSRRPLVYHLHDIISSEHFSLFNRWVIVALANNFATAIIANSKASQAAFIAAHGRATVTHVIYNGFHLHQYQNLTAEAQLIRQRFNLAERFVVGSFSRLSPWKGQHVLLEALAQCPKDITVLLVGDALFGEYAYVEQLHQQVAALGLQDRVHFLGFCADVPQIMAACDLIVHSSTAPEPFGRVIVEAMLCGRPVVASAAGGVMELIHHGVTGWLVPPSDSAKLAQMMIQCCYQLKFSETVAHQAQVEAVNRFNLTVTNQQIAHVLINLI